MQAIRLKTEHLFDPVGVDFTAPRLFWNCKGGKKQTAYQIVAEDDRGNLLWDSQKVESASMRANWNGAPVAQRRRYCGKYAYGMKTTSAEIGMRRCSRRELTFGRRNGSPEITRSIKGSAIPWTVLEKNLLSPM